MLSMALRCFAARNPAGIWASCASAKNMAWFSAQAAGNQQGAESRHTSHGNDTVQNGGSGNFGGSGAPHTPREEASADQRAIVLPMPKLSHSMTHGRVLKWHVSEGSPVAVYDVIATVETETLVEEAYRLDQFAGKVSLLVESQEEGFVARLLAAEGEEVPVGRPIALLCEDADEVQAVSGGADCWLQRVRDVYSSGAGVPRLRLLEWQSYLARGPPSSGCL